jgi:hypothetical protein
VCAVRRKTSSNKIASSPDARALFLVPFKKNEKKEKLFSALQKNTPPPPPVSRNSSL